MTSKKALSQTIPVIHGTIIGQPVDDTSIKLGNVLQKIWQYLKGGNEDKRREPDPALAIILQIEDQEVAKIVRDLHYKTPKSLQAMRKVCEECFILPDDCPYYDYSIFDVKKAVRRLVVQPKHTYEQTIVELQKINQELAYHLNEYLE